MSQPQPIFRLPDFVRVTWVSEDAKVAWQPRLNQIRDAWPRLAVDLVAAMHCDVFLRTIPPWMIFRLQAEAKRRGVVVTVLGVRGVAVPGYAYAVQDTHAGKPFVYDVAIGTQAATDAMEAFWERSDYAPAYRSAGVSECCLKALKEDIETQRIDPTARFAGTEGSLPPDAGDLADSLWRWLNIERASYVPCSHLCAETRVGNLRWTEAATAMGYKLEVDWLRDIVSWPVEWSALHGIAEVRTPILKFACTTDATNEKLVVRYHGNGYPKEGANGLTFPYRRSDKPALTSSSSFRRGLENLIQIGQVD
jgi:hypothetical protein